MPKKPHMGNKTHGRTVMFEHHLMTVWGQVEYHWKLPLALRCSNVSWLGSHWFVWVIVSRASAYLEYIIPSPKHSIKHYIFCTYLPFKTIDCLTYTQTWLSIIVRPLSCSYVRNSAGGVNVMLSDIDFAFVLNNIFFISDTKTKSILNPWILLMLTNLHENSQCTNFGWYVLLFSHKTGKVNGISLIKLAAYSFLHIWNHSWYY